MAFPSRKGHSEGLTRRGVNPDTRCEEKFANKFARVECTILIWIGISGIGKTTIGKLLSQSTGWTFEDTDNCHFQVKASFRFGLLEKRPGC
jgi:hypothetical protein